MRFTLLLVVICSLLLSPRHSSAEQVCSTNSTVGIDLTMLNAAVTDGYLVTDVLAATPFDSLAITTTSQVSFFIDGDQNRDTGDLRPGTIRGVDYRIDCLAGMVTSCSIYRLPSSPYGAEEKVNVPVTSYLTYNGYGLRVVIPAIAAASDVFAFAHGRTRALSSGTGNGDRCPEVGFYDTATGITKVPYTEVIQAQIDDQSGPALLGWTFETFGDQFRIVTGYKELINLFSLNFAGRFELDTDRSLATGLVHTPFLNPSPFNEIPTWGWDVAIQIQGGSQGGSDPTPFYLDFGHQSIYSQPPRSYAFPYGFPFGEKYNDGRWYVRGNVLILEGSLSMLDARTWTPTSVNRIPADGKLAGRFFTNAGVRITDMVPKGGAYNTGTNSIVPALGWSSSAVSAADPGGEYAAQFDLTGVDAQIQNGNLVVRGTVERIDPSWRDTHYILFLDTDGNSATGETVSEGGTPIGADYVVTVVPTDQYSFFDFRTSLLRSGGSGGAEGHDSWLNVRYSESYLAPGRIILTIPLSSIGNATSARLYLGTIAIYNNQPMIQDFVPANTPLAVGTAGSSYSVAGVVRAGSTPISGATVSLGGKSATTGATGAFTVTGITAGTHFLTISAAGYRTYTNSSYSVAGNQAGLVFQLEPVVTPSVATLTVSIEGQGSVNSNPAGIACAAGSSALCSHSFTTGTGVTLTPTPSAGYLLANWWGGCTSIVNNNCLVSMTENKTLRATFALSPRVRVVGMGAFDSLQSAYDAASQGAEIQAQSGALSGNLMLDKGKRVFLGGGYDSGYLDNRGRMTVLQGTLRLRSGSITVENIAIR